MPTVIRLENWQIVISRARNNTFEQTKKSRTTYLLEQDCPTLGVPPLGRQPTWQQHACVEFNWKFLNTIE